MDLLARSRPLLFASSLALAACSSAPADRGALGLEGDLLAPCCFNGTLATHESDLARTLRAEIEQRVDHGEPTAAIKADMVQRYGPAVLAMPNEKRFDSFLSLAGLVALILSVVLVLRVRSWLRAKPTQDASPSPPAPAAVTKKDAYDDRIDAELDAIE